ncbi:MotA/TolQ/ExbB proton channel family protein [Psychromonas antarctica]|jgi:biopolymer transport protein ExbB|uniref:MotA/TolQ/ExbB proton channel family protein n=1 Tax=Psychromonas antarctica TaxID=67573 RepID=UPI001EE8F318|nr:MotA/TolQ/ExbB proton channel family protein [Psychromonas antarctica]MCG6201634.1 MotA/TolQ/ExbB proton channel family protein [Psychromonas antarctica]
MVPDSALNTLASSSIFQEIQQTMPQWFQQGGVVMWLLLLASFLTTLVTLERLSVWINYYFTRESVPLRNCFKALNQEQQKVALQFCQRLNTPVLNMLAHGIKALPFPPNEIMESYAERQISSMSRGQSLLDTVITLAPMLGILGTVLGIIDSFNILSLQGVENPTAVVGGIAQALISTAMGLSVALLALLPYNLFRSFIQKLTLHLECVGSEFYHICHQKSLITNQSEIIDRHNVLHSLPKATQQSLTEMYANAIDKKERPEEKEMKSQTAVEKVQ